MIPLKKYLLPSAMAVLTVCVTMLSYRPTQDEQEQIAFITGFYKQYLVNRQIRQTGDLPDSSFYSRGLAALLAVSHQRDGDVVLGTQDAAPDLTFDKLRFKTARAGKNTIDASFNVEPYDRHVKYVFIREANGWRVDDVYTDGKSLRTMVADESRRNGDLADTAAKVLRHLASAESSHYVEERMAFPVLLCDASNICIQAGPGDAKLCEALVALRLAYYGEAESINTPDLRALPGKGQEQAVEGKVVALDALDFSFRRGAWRITAIDLRRLGSAIPIQAPLIAW